MKIALITTVLFLCITIITIPVTLFITALNSNSDCSVLMPEKSELVENLGNDWFVYKIKILEQEKYFLIKSKYKTKIEGITEISYLR